MDPKIYTIALIFASGFEIVLFATVRLIKTHGHVSAAKKAMWCTSVLFTGTANSPISNLVFLLSNSHILCPLYTQPYIPNLKEIGE